MVDIYLVGVGGQGIITASKIIGDAAIVAGKDVVLSETHGMAQRGGSVVCTARIGDYASPLIPDGKADVVLSLELLETLRAIPKCSKRTLAIASTEKMVPLSVSTQKLRYPTVEEVRARFESVAKGLVVVDARRLAEEAGVPMSSNVVMVGALAGSGTTGLDRKYFERAVEMNIPRRLSENLEAFGKGFETGKSATH
jgi:indolepyruvate ferredoxin oxidoreductase beta subunit